MFRWVKNSPFVALVGFGLESPRESQFKEVRLAILGLEECGQSHLGVELN